MVFIALQGALVQNSLINFHIVYVIFWCRNYPDAIWNKLFSSNTFKPITKIKVNKTMPYLTVVIAILLIVRGANLDIPYLSPSYDEQTNEMSCCHKLR